MRTTIQFFVLGLMAAVVAVSVGLLCGASDGGSQSEAKDVGPVVVVLPDGGSAKPSPTGAPQTINSNSVEFVFSKPAKVYLAKTETTVAQYQKCVKADKCPKPKTKDDNKYCNWGYDDRAKHPINCVDGIEAESFCAWIGGRLPTEEEWFAEASNTGRRLYPWGDADVSCDYAIFSPGGGGCGRASTWPVCSKTAGNSVSGLCDMSGNVSEWTTSSSRTRHVVRGGSWDPNFGQYALRASTSTFFRPPGRYYLFGFRCAMSVP